MYNRKQSTVQRHESLFFCFKKCFDVIFVSIPAFISMHILFLPLLEPHSTGGDGDGDDDLADQYMRYVLVRSRLLLSDP